MKTPNPLVSICIPTYNAARWLEECVHSALAQTYGETEILIVDDASTDRTVEIARAFGDGRVRVSVNERNRGLVGNWNECVRLARGQYVKFLFQDDLLYPRCVERLMEPFGENPSLGLTFSPRDIIAEGASAGDEWVQTYSDLHARFDRLSRMNDGRELFAQHLVKRFNWSCVGEPTSVLIKKECFERVGLFNPRLQQACDIEMWLRIMYFYDVGFVDEKLSAFRHHADSASSANERAARGVFDPFWLLEGLLSHAEIRRSHPEIKRMRDEQLLQHIPLRPSAGWKSLRSGDGLRRALGDIKLLPSRLGFLLTYLARRRQAGSNRSAGRK